MRLKTLILLGCVLLLSSTCWADVGGIAIRLNADGRIVDIATTVIGQKLTSEGNGSLEEETPVTDVDPMPATTTDCEFDASGNTAGNCSCPLTSSESEGTLVFMGEHYVCCDEATHQIYRNGSYSKVLMPYCGCSDGYRSPWTGDAQICCKEGKRWYNTLESETPTSVSDSRCGCPDNSTMVVWNGATHCCRGGIDLATSTSGEVNREICGCVAEDSTVCTKALCTASTGYAWCELTSQCVNDDSCQINDKEACLAVEAHWCLSSSGQAVCQKEACCSGEDEQQADNGACVKCPAEGSLTLYEGQYHCCNGTLLYDEATALWRVDYAICGCPSGGSYDADAEVCCQGNFAYDSNADSYTLINAACGCPNEGIYNADAEICCQNSFAWNSESSAYTLINAACGCPNGGTKVEDICCMAGKEGVGTTYAKENAVCGCLSGHTKVEIDDYRVCCSNGEITAGVDDPTVAQNVRFCGCSNTEKQFVESGEIICCAGGVVTKRTGGSVTPEDAACRCSKGGAWSTSAQMCVACLSDADCGASTPVCQEDSETGAKACVSCESIDSTKPHYADGACYECTENEHCANRSDGKHVCEQARHVCEACDLDAQDDNGCVEERPYCTKSFNGIIACSECRGDDDCKTNEKGKFCNKNSTEMQCSDECGSVGFNSETGKCNCSGETPVWDIYDKKCVVCYDSVPEDWTDLGCSSDSDYSPRNTAKNGKPICKITKTSSGTGTSDTRACVQCLEDAHCRGDFVCKNNACSCPTNKPHFVNNQCTACTGNYKANDSTTGLCTSSKPVCTSSGCKTCKEVDSTKPRWNGSECDACSTNQTWNATKGKCMCNEGYCMKNSACVQVNDYNDVTRDSEGVCSKKSLKDTTYTMDRKSQSVAGGCNKYTTLEKLKIVDKNSSKLKLMYSHEATVTTNYADDCTYGTFVGEITATPTKGKTCRKHVSDKSNQGSGTFQANITIPAGTHNSIYIEFEDIHCGTIGGAGNITLKD